VNKLLPAIVILCLVLGGCGVVSLSVSNSPDWCPNPRNAVTCP
jgi:hypothetical protein